MEAPRFLRCLGLPALFSPSGEPIRFRTKKHIALLVYLAVEGRRFHHREHLADLLWPGVRGQEARHSLATALSVLRPRMGNGALQTTREQVTLTPGHLSLDLDRLLGGDVLGSEVTSPLDVANFLDGFDIPDASEFAIWKDRQQARLLPAIKDALVLLIDRCRRTGDTRQIEQLADRMLALDELSEDAIRAKMESRAFAGDRVGALKIFEEWKTRLADELGATPSELLEGMAMRLRRRGWERTPIAEIPSVPSDQLKARPFVGRTAEYRVLYEAWERLRTGLPAHSFVLGDSGVGKSTLVMRLTAAAALEGAVITRVQSYDLERDIPYSTLGGLVHGLLDRPGVSATPPEALAEIARTVPAVRRRFPGLPEIPDSQGETARIRLTEAFHQMLTTIVDEHPVILVVDDLHLADDASLAVLHLVMRRAKGQMIMVVMVARPGELTNSPQAARLRESAETLGIREIELTPLSPEDSADLLAALVPPEHPQPGSSAKRALLRAAGGFPMVLELLTQDWQAHGDQSLALAVDAMTSDLESGTGPTAAYHHIMARLVRTLDHQTQNVLSLAAVLGHRLNDLTMYGLLDMSFGQTMAGLSELTSRRVLRDGSGGLEFVNELIRASAYTGVPSSLRRALHSSVVDRLLSAEHYRDAASGLEIAWHCIRAGRDQEATPYLLSGARAAIRKGAPDVAEHALASALPGLKEPEATEARFLLVEVLQEQGRWLESLDMLGTLPPVQKAGRKDEILLFTAMANYHISTSTARVIFERLDELIHIIDGDAPLHIKARVARVTALLLSAFGNREACRTFLDLVNEISEDGLDPDSIAHITLARALLYHEAGLRTESMSIAEVGLARLRELGVANAVMGQLQAGLGSINARRGFYETAIQHHETAFKMATRLGNDTMTRIIAGNIALCFFRLGRYDKQSSWLDRAPRVKDGDFSGFIEVQISYQKAAMHFYYGRREQAQHVIDSMEARLTPTLAPWMLQAWHFYKADLMWMAGRPAEALKQASEELQQNSYRLLSSSFAGAFARWAVLTRHQTGNWERTQQILEQMVSQVEDYDALDQAEILAAMRTAYSEGGSARSSLDERLADKLQALPDATRNYLGMFFENLTATLGVPSTATP